MYACVWGESAMQILRDRLLNQNFGQLDTISDKVKFFFVNCTIKRPQAEYPLEVIIMNKAEILVAYHLGLTITIEYGKGEN